MLELKIFQVYNADVCLEQHYVTKAYDLGNGNFLLQTIMLFRRQNEKYF